MAGGTEGDTAERSGESPESTSKRGEAVHAATNGSALNGAGQVLIDLDFVRGLIEAVDRSGVDTLEIHRGGTRIRISKSPPPAPAAPTAVAPAAAPPSGHSAPEAVASHPAVVVEPEAAKTNLVDVPSPMVGTFYRAPVPEAPPYVEVGSPVSKGETLCILEAMKLMNELECEVDGTVREILVENGDPVEYGQVLFRIEPNGSTS